MPEVSRRVSDESENPLLPGGASIVRVRRLTFQVGKLRPEGAFRRLKQQEQGFWGEESWVSIQIPPCMAVV